METGCVFDMVKGGMGIAELNEMQRAMGADVSRRVMLTAPTGSGKTVAFVIRMLREVRPWVPCVQGLVVAPTRELVRQVAGVVKGILNFEGGGLRGDSAYASSRGCNSGEVVNRRPADACVGEDGTRLGAAGIVGSGEGTRGAGACVGGVRCVCLYGGHDMRTEVGELEGAMAAGMAVVVVATPGRLVDHMNRRTVDLSGVRCVVVDEFDKCLEMGFQEEMGRILNFEDGEDRANGPNRANGADRTNWGDGGDGVGRRRAARVPAGACVVLTSATRGMALPGFVGDVGRYRRYEYGEGETSPAGEVVVTEVVSPSRDKPDTLEGVLRSLDNGRVMVFVNHRESAERVYGVLKGRGWPVVLYHGGLDQQQRRVAVELLTNGSAPVMVATDLAARGLDIEGVEAVVHYHVPVDAETWTHRNGRTGRQGAAGRVFVILNSEGGMGKEGDGANRANRGDRADGVVGVEEFLRDGVMYGGRVTELGVSGDPIRAVWVTLYINAGRKEKISKGDVAGYVMQKGGLDRGEVGRIAVEDHYALAAVPVGRGAELARVLSGEKIKGRRVKVSVIRN